MTSPLVSIIIDNYNYAQFLGAAINSALAQTHKQLEVIVVDDGSTDGSRAVLTTYNGRIKTVLKENGGQASAFNAGFAVSAGDLVAFLDSDDLLLQNAIEQVVENWRSGLSKLQFALRIIDRDGQPTGATMPRMRLEEGDLQTLLLSTGRYVTAPTSGNVFSRTFLCQVLPIPEAEWGRGETGDGYLNTCAPFYGEIGAVQDCLGFYRVHGMSMSSTSVAGSINLAQIKKVIRHHLLEKALLERIAKERSLVVKESVIVSHWMHLKLRVAQLKMEGGSYSRGLVRSSWQMIASAVGDPQLNWVRKMQHVAWTLGVLVLPREQAGGLINMAFETASGSRFARVLRRF